MKKTTKTPFLKVHHLLALLLLNFFVAPAYTAEVNNQKVNYPNLKV